MNGSRKAHYLPVTLTCRKSKSSLRNLTSRRGYARATSERRQPEPLSSGEESPTSAPASSAPRQAAHAAVRYPMPHPMVFLGTTLVELDGVVFPSRPAERYRVAVKHTLDTRETILLLENLSSFEQKSFTFSDITSLCENPNTMIPGRTVFQALYKSLMDLSEQVVVPPRELPDSEARANTDDPSTIDFVHEESLEQIVLTYSQMRGVRYLFPMTSVVDEPRVLALREALQKTQQERDAAKNELEQLNSKYQNALATIGEQTLEIQQLHAPQEADRD